MCCKDLQFELPEITNKLHLVEKGFRKINPLNSYVNLMSLWLNNNSIEKVENLDGLKSLVCLFLNNNKIKKI